MRVLQVIDDLNAEGAQSLLLDLCLRWKRNGLNPEVFALHGGNSLYRTRLEDRGIPVTVSSQSALYSPMHVQELVAIISNNRFDVVHVHLHPAQLWAAVALRIAAAAPPGITTEHSTWNRRRDHRWCRPIDRWTYSQFQLAVCISTATKNSLDAWIGAGVCPTCVVANGTDLTRFGRQHVPALLPNGGVAVPTVLCVARFTELKGQETLVRAIAEVEGAHVLLAGDGPLRQTVQQIARQLRVDNRVHFLGIRHDIPELIAAANVYVQPSRVDGFCLAALEAMAGGLPVIASDIPGLGELVGDCGLLFPSGDHRQLARCIRKLLFDTKLASELSARGTKRAQQFSIDETAAQYEEIFERIASTPIYPID